MATKFGQRKTKIALLRKKSRTFCTNSKVFGVGEFKYAIQNFKGVKGKGVAMATKFRQKYAKIALILVRC